MLILRESLREMKNYLGKDKDSVVLGEDKSSIPCQDNYKERIKGRWHGQDFHVKAE